MTPLFEADGLSGDYDPRALDPALQCAGYRGIIPGGITQTHVMYVNKAVLAACGLTPATTYEELKAQVAPLAAQGYKTVVMPNLETWTMQSCLFSDLAGRLGGSGWSNRILAGDASFTDDFFVNALSFVKTLYADGVLDASSLTTGYADGPIGFANGEYAYYIDGDWRAGAFRWGYGENDAEIPVADQSNVSVQVFPVIDGAALNDSSSVVLGTGWGINADIPAGSDREKAAWALVKWLEGHEAQVWRAETGAVPVPSRTDIDMMDLELQPIQRVVGDLPSTYTNYTTVIDSVFVAAVYDVLNQGLHELGTGEASPADVAASVQAAFETWVASQ